MTLIFAVIFYGGLLAIGYIFAKRARKSWYPKYMPEAMAIAICAALGAIVWINAAYDDSRVSVGQAE